MVKKLCGKTKVFKMVRKKGKFKKNRQFSEYVKRKRHDDYSKNNGEKDTVDIADIADMCELVADDSFSFLRATDCTKENTTLKRKVSDVEESDDDLSEVGESYEKYPRHFKEQHEIRVLLPVKGKNGIIFNSEVVSKNDDLPYVENKINSKKSLICKKSFIEEYVNKQKLKTQLKLKIGILSTLVVEDPQNNLKALKDLLHMLKETDSTVHFTIKKLLALSILHVFSDILPGYKIRLPADNEKGTLLKKETRKLRDYESSLLRYYKSYLQCLETMLNGLKNRYLIKAKVSRVKKEVLREVALVGVKCLCNICEKHFNFNYNKNVTNIIIPLMAHSNEEVSDMCCKAIERVFETDKLGEASLDVVKQTCRLIKEKKFCIPGRVIQVFLSLNIKEVDLQQSSKIDMKNARKQMYMMSKKERKYKKRMRELEHELRETEAEENKEKKKKIHTEILKQVFWIYFSILKNNSEFFLMTPVLEGLSKFSHHINIEYFDDLSSILCNLMNYENLSDVQKLLCMQTLFVILSGHGESLNIDPQKFYICLYNMLLNLECSKEFAHVLKCVELMIVKRKKKITFNRIAAFVKRLCTAAVQSPLNGTLSLVAVIRHIMQNTLHCDILLDTETSIGSGTFIPELEDPEHCNAHSSALWELHFFCKHYSSVVSTYACHILNGCPDKGKGELPDHLLNIVPEEFLTCYNNNDEYKKVPMNLIKKVNKRGHSYSCNNTFNANDVNSCLENIKEVDFFKYMCSAK